MIFFKLFFFLKLWFFSDCDCLHMSFDDNIHDGGCNAAYNYAEPWKVTYIEGVADNALCLSGKQRVISELFSNWLDGSPRDSLTVTMWIYMSCGKSAAKHYQVGGFSPDVNNEL